MAKNRRRKLYLDHELQKTLMIRLSVYWLTFVVALAWFEVCRVVPTRQPGSVGELFQQVWSLCGPALIASVLMLPALAIDCLRLTHRFAGPIYRIRRAMADLADGRPVKPQKLRANDFLHDLAVDFNRVAELVQKQRDEKDETALPETAEHLRTTDPISTAKPATAENASKEEATAGAYPGLAKRAGSPSAHEMN